MKRWIAYCIAPLLGIAGAIGVIIMMSACATTQTVLPPEQLQIQEIIEANRPQNELYVLTMEWMAKAFKSSKAVIQYEDKEAGMIVGKGFLEVQYMGEFAKGLLEAAMEERSEPVYTWFTLTVEVKDNKTRVTFSDFYVDWHGEEPVLYQSQMDKIHPEIQGLISNLRLFLETGKEEW